MSQLFLASDADALADRLLEEIAARRPAADPFEPIPIVVPNRFVQQWLKFRIARAWGVAVNLQFTFLEHALWDWLRDIDPRAHAQPPELLDEERYNILVLSLLWEKGTQTFSGSRRECRRTWQLARRFGTLIRDYEYHRQDAIIQQWLDPKGRVDVPTDWRERETMQRDVFRRVTEDDVGRRAVLNRVLGRNFKTLPQYVMEFFHEVSDYRVPQPRVIHLFGLAQISPLHLRALELLGKFHDWRIYHLNPLVSRVESTSLAALRTLAKTYRAEDRPDDRPGTELLQAWGRAGVESLDLTADFLRDPKVRATVLPPQPPGSPTVLRRLQGMILGQTDVAEPRLPQDTSLQVLRCPGIWREAETIHAGIVNAMHLDPSLQQSDVAVLVTNVDLYRPVLAAVFERPPRRLSYAMADYTAARVSMFGQAVVGMLDLALENLSRSRVFEVLLNPCVLARMKVDRESALHWLTWAEKLGIYHGWDAAEKREQGYAASPLYSWRLGLQKLRLGQYMSVGRDDSREPAPEWQGVIPFADVESGDRDRLDQFCRLVEGLLPMLVRLRGMKAHAAAWAEAILTLMQRFVAVPEDRPHEEPVQALLIESMRRFAEWDTLHEGDSALLPLAMVREFIFSRLQDIPGRRNEVLSSGVTIAALQPQRPIPFDVIFLAGMGEKHFPGGASPGPFDLRQIRRQDGDILPIEQQRYGFLEAILSARKKLVITYDARDLQKDADLQPAIPLAQLQRFAAKNILTDAVFHAATAPLASHDPALLDVAQFPAYQDCLVHDNVVDRVLALDAAERAGRLDLDAVDAAALSAARRRLTPTFPMPPTDDIRQIPTVALSKLRKFLENPADAALRYHLRASDEWDDGGDEDFEPLVSPKYVGIRLVEAVLQGIVRRAESEPLDAIRAEWRAEFDRKYREGTLRGQLPEGAFAQVDAEILRADIETGLTTGGLLEFLEGQAAKESVGPFLIGESDTPIGAKQHRDALVMRLDRRLLRYPAGDVRLVGSWPFAWRDATSFDLLVFPRERLNSANPLSSKLFEPLLFVLALAAAGELGERRATLCVVQDKGILPLALNGDVLEREAAMDYLSELATDFLDVGCADQLPFKFLESPASRRNIYRASDGLSDAKELLSDLRSCEADQDWKDKRLIELTVLGFRVPDDAAQKLRRRLRPLALLLPDSFPRSRGRSKGGDA